MSRPRNLFVFVALIALSAALAACGGGGSSDDPQTVVDDATLQGIESAEIDLSLEVGVEGEKGGDVDVSLSGPFQRDEGAELPELDLSFAAKGSIGGKKLDREGAFTLLGNKAYVGYEGTEYAVDSTTFNFVKSMIKQQTGDQGKEGESSSCQEAVAELEPGDFLENLKEEGSADVGGTSTTKVSGDLDVVGAVETASELSEDPACSTQLSATGAFPSAAELDKAKDTVKDSVKSAHAVLYVGDDNIVRRIVAEATIEPPKSADASAKRVDIDLDLTLTGVNEDQTISAPTATRPLSALFIKLGVNPIELLGAFQNGGGTEGLGNLLEGLGVEGSSAGGGKGGSPSGGKEAYLECLGEADTPVDIQNCTGLLQ